MRIFKQSVFWGTLEIKSDINCIAFLIIMDKKTYLYIMYYFDKNDG